MFVFSESFIIVTPLVFYFALHGWSRDVVRETIKKCNMVSVNVFIFGFAPFVLSEGILFISVFWGLVHFMLTPFFSNHEALFVPDATELTYAILSRKFIFGIACLPSVIIHRFCYWFLLLFYGSLYHSRLFLKPFVH